MCSQRFIQERRDSRPMALQKLGSFIKNPRSSSSKNLGSSHDSQRSLKSSSRNSLVLETRKAQLLDEGGRSFDPSLSILQSELHPNDAFVRDDFYEPFDSYDVDLLLPPKPKVKKESQTKLLRRGPRLAGFMPWRLVPKYDWGLTAEDFLNDRLNLHEDSEKVDENMTTLLHEACRLASPEFVRLLLSNGGNPNVRNGMQRTALHMVAGGLTELESKFFNRGDSKNAEVGIRTPVIDLRDQDAEENIDEKIHQKAARAVSRMFTKSKQLKTGTVQGLNSNGPTQSNDDFDNYTSQRMDTLLAILSWFHPDDNSPSAGEGPTVNSVDFRGRAALHYAAEMGRTDLCLTILTSFGAILTIVDEAGQTPGELAAEQNHPNLAAQLEARALLYSDPYGLDEDLFASVWEESSDDETVAASKTKKKKAKQTLQSKLVPPFSWYETWTMDKVRSERQRLVAKFFDELRDALLSKQNDRESLEFMYNHGFEEGLDSDYWWCRCRAPHR
jgi:Ankyrin repeat